MSLHSSPEALDVALQSISKTAFRPSRDPSVCFTVPSPNPSLCFSAPLASGHSYSSFSDLRLHSPGDGSQSEGNWVLTDRDGPDGNNLEVVHDDPFKTSNDSDRFDQEDFADEKSWVPVDASSLEASIISDATDFGSRPPPLPSRPRSATDPHMLLRPLSVHHCSVTLRLRASPGTLHSYSQTAFQIARQLLLHSGSVL